MNVVVGVDVGGSVIKAGIVSPNGRLERPAATPVPRTDDVVGRVLDAVHDLVERVRGDDECRAVGVAVPGVVDERAGLAVWSENLGWHNAPIRAALEERVTCPVVLAHDVRAGGVAEHRIGACRGARDAAFVPVGTGIAAAIVLDDEVRSAGGMAGEFGHIDVGHSRLCACGATGCLEAIASAASVARRYTEVTGTTVDGAREVAARVRDGDAAATEIWGEAIDALARGLVILAGVVAPEIVAIGGGMSEARDLVIDPLHQAVRRRLTFQRMPRIVPAVLGDRAGNVGAGLLAWDSVGSLTPSTSVGDGDCRGGGAR